VTGSTVQTTQLGPQIHRTDCDNGLVVLTEHLPGVRSAAAGIWVRTASGHETPEVMGVSHLLEHMVFKGTERRSAREIALSLESRGGSLDAYTSRDNTTYQAHVLDQDLPLALDVLTDLVRRPLLRDSDLALERNVVLEEINGVADTPDDLVHELFAETLFPSHPYGRPILGTADTVSALQTGHLRQKHDSGYHPGNCVISVAGNVRHEQVLDLLDALGWFEGERKPALEPVEKAQAIRGNRRVESRDLQQVHAVLGVDTFGAGDSRRWPMALLSTTLGGGMSSRLFQRVREELGLCYAIYSWHSSYRSGGVFGVYVGTQPSTADRAIDAIESELRRVASEGLPADDLADAKGQLKGQLMLALESTTARMSRLASHALNDEPYRSPDELLRLVEAVTQEETAEIAASFLAPEQMSAVRLGPDR
jgi:predicted Zn-dependent peptidase